MSIYGVAVRSWKLLPGFIAVTTLNGCSVQGIKEERQRETAELSTLYVDATAEPPAKAELAENLGSPEVHHAEDLTLHKYPLQYNQLKALHASTRKATERRRKEAEIARQGAGAKDGGRGLSEAETAAMIVLAPVAVAGLLLAIPLAAADVAVGSAIVAAGGDDRPEKLAGRRALFVYGPDGTYRWHACCLRAGKEETKPEFDGLPDPLSAYVLAKDKLPDAYRPDSLVIRCHRAKSGDRFAQFQTFDDFNELVPDPVPAYYWARVLEDNPTPGWRRPLAKIEEALSGDELTAAEDNHAATPLETADCRGLAERLIAAADSGSVGRKLAQ